MSISFVWLSFNTFGRSKVKLQQFFGDVCVFQAYKFSRKTAVKFQKCFCLILFLKFVTIIWNNLGQSNYKCTKRNLDFTKKELFSPLFKRDSSWLNEFVASLNHSIILGRIFC